MTSKEIYDEVNSRYGSIAQSGSTLGKYARTVASSFGYTAEELASVPEGANLGLSCGNPTAMAKLRQGETVVDLGCGAGLDVFFASKKVGPKGMAIGVDMNKDMLEKANANATKSNAKNVRFIECPITKIALKDSMADCVISNCVMNLVPEKDKQLAFNEIYRILKPGGRVAISDILGRKPLPEQMKQSMALRVGCIAGVSHVAEYEEYLKNAGFNDVLIVDTKNDINVYFTAGEDGSGECCPPAKKASGCCPPDAPTATPEQCCTTSQKESCCPPQSSEASAAGLAREITAAMGKIDWNDWVGSFSVYAVKSQGA